MQSAILILCFKNISPISVITQKDIGLKENSMAGDGLRPLGKDGSYW